MQPAVPGRLSNRNSRVREDLESRLEAAAVREEADPALRSHQLSIDAASADQHSPRPGQVRCHCNHSSSRCDSPPARMPSSPTARAHPAVAEYAAYYHPQHGRLATSPCDMHHPPLYPPAYSPYHISPSHAPSPPGWVPYPALAPPLAYGHQHSPQGPVQVSYPTQPGGPGGSGPLSSGVLTVANGQGPSTLSVQLAPEPPENADLSAKCLMELQQLWEEWHGFGARNLAPEVVPSALKSLAHRTAGAVGPASQGSVTRHQAQELLAYAVEVLREHEDEEGGHFLALLQDSLAAAGPRGPALVSNIVTGGRQMMTGSKQFQAVKADANTKVDMKSTSSSFSKAFLDASRKGGAWMTALKVAAGAAAALAGARLHGAGVRFAGGGGGSGQGRSRSSGGRRGRSKGSRGITVRQFNSVDDRRVQCELANAKAREYLDELRNNRLNPAWHKDPPHNSCAMPQDNLPWRARGDARDEDE